MTTRKQKQSTLWFNKVNTLILVFIVACSLEIKAQCLSSVNPVGGTENLLVLEKKSLRIITFYKYGSGKHYFEGNQHSEFNLIQKAYYNYLTSIIGYGLSSRLTIETEAGYFINKTQLYNTQPEYTLTGKGFSNLVASVKYTLYSNHVKRIYYSAATGIKIPFTRDPQIVNNVQLPVEVQPNIGAFGVVVNSYFVKEYSESGFRFFITNRIEHNFPNRNDYQLGTVMFNSFFISKHLMFPWLNKGDWTTILQLRNEIRAHDKVSGEVKESSGGVLFFLIPQVNHVIKEKWYVSVMIDIPVYQYFYGTQLGSGFGLTLSLSRTLSFIEGKL